MRKTLIIAEAGVNHNGDLERAKDLIRKAAWAGADIIKFQLYTADKLVTKKAPKFWSWEGDMERKTQYEAYDALDNFPKENYPELIKTCEENHIEFLCTPFDFEAVDYLDSIGMKSFKVSSSDLNNLPFLKHIARKGKPIYLSTGAATLGEVEEAVDAIKQEGNKKIILLHCTLCYPTKFEDVNLNNISLLKRVFPDLEVGISDHSMGITVPIAATTLGIAAIEKHYTIDKGLPYSADHWLSVDHNELKQLVEGVRNVEKAMGSSVKKIFPCEKITRKFDKRSIVAAKDIKKGESFTAENLTFKRPGTGIPPKYIDIIVGRKANRKIKADTILQWTKI